MKKTGMVNLLKGTAIGASMLVPGMSGGTMAIVLGIYDDIIHAVSSFFQNKRKRRERPKTDTPARSRAGLLF